MAVDQEDRRNGSERSTVLLKAAKYAAVGFEFPTTVAAGFFLGYYLDEYFDTRPWLVLIMGIAGIVVAFYRMIVLLRHLSRDVK